MIIVFFGPPGCGKGTQSALITRRYKTPQISSGDILREAQELHTPLGFHADFYINQGQYLPDDLMIEVMLEIIKGDDCENGFILDGFPRTVPQADALIQSLKKMEKRVDAVFYFDISSHILVDRLTGRRTCKSCGSIWHLTYKPLISGCCPDCGSGQLVHRVDDREEVILERFRIYETRTLPLLGYFQGRNILTSLNAERDVSLITRDIFAVLDPISRKEG